MSKREIIINKIISSITIILYIINAIGAIKLINTNSNTYTKKIAIRSLW